jgi:hypothetical protein
MALFQRQYALVAPPPPVIQPQLTPLPMWGIHVTYTEYFRKAIKPGEIEPLFLILPRMSYRDGSFSVVAEATLTDLPSGRGMAASMRGPRSLRCSAHCDRAHRTGGGHHERRDHESDYGTRRPTCASEPCVWRRGDARHVLRSNRRHPAGSNSTASAKRKRT